jgi:hypothetical protein
LPYDCVHKVWGHPDFTGSQKYIKRECHLQPIISTIRAPTYSLKRHLADVWATSHTMWNFEDFFHTLDTLQVNPSDTTVRFDMISIFTNVSTVDTLHILSWHFDEDNIRFFSITPWLPFFCFYGQFNKQMDGAAIGLQPSLLIVNVFMENWAVNTAAYKHCCWFWYIDNTSMIYMTHGPEKLNLWIL